MQIDAPSRRLNDHISFMAYKDAECHIQEVFAARLVIAVTEQTFHFQQPNNEDCRIF